MASAQKRVDVKWRKSRYNRRTEHDAAFADLVAAIRAPLIVVSFSDEGFQTREQIEATLRGRGRVFVLERDYPRYVGARIGIHSPTGAKVGSVGRLRNVEHLFLVGAGAGEVVASMDGSATDIVT